MRAVVLGLVGTTALSFAQDVSKKDAKFFDKRVAPILTKRCLGCHSDELNDGGLSFQDRESLFKKPVVVSGRPEESLLVRAIQHDGDIKMPPGPKLPDKDIATLTEWVRRGVPWGSKLRRQP